MCYKLIFWGLSFCPHRGQGEEGVSVLPTASPLPDPRKVAKPPGKAAALAALS